MTTSENQIVVYQPNETVWLNRHQMAQLFGRDVKTIGKHIANALSEELASNSVVSDFATTQPPQCPTVDKMDAVSIYTQVLPHFIAEMTVRQRRCA